MLIVPADTPGVRIRRSYPVFGYHDQHGHCLVELDEVRVPVSNLLGEEGGGFAAAQARLGPGRIHHVMRALGAGERALAMMVSRTQERVAFGRPLAEQSSVRERIAESRIELEQARALCHRAAHVVDTEGNKEARHLIAAAKVAVPRAVGAVIDRAIQVHGAAGISDATPLAAMYAWHRAMRIFDGPDEVHLTSLARSELNADPLFDLPPVGPS
jgi:acyl-CoA dehydrogenase